MSHILCYRRTYFLRADNRSTITFLSIFEISQGNFLGKKFSVAQTIKQYLFYFRINTRVILFNTIVSCDANRLAIISESNHRNISVCHIGSNELFYLLRFYWLLKSDFKIPTTSKINTGTKTTCKEGSYTNGCEDNSYNKGNFI